MGLIRPKPRITIISVDRNDRTNPQTLERYASEYEFSMPAVGHGQTKMVHFRLVPPPQSGQEALEIPYDQLIELMEELKNDDAP
jgi:hypothetical protein